MTKIGGTDLFAQAALLPTAVADLARIEGLPLALGAFFALLAARRSRTPWSRPCAGGVATSRCCAPIGFTRRQTRGAIAWQSTLLAVAGIVVGVPIGIAVGRIAWRWLADDFPIVYVPPAALLAVFGVAAIAIVIANVLAAGPAHAATRIRPAEALRVE